MVKYVDSGLEDTNGNDGGFSGSKYGNYAFSSLGSSIGNSNSAESHSSGGINNKKKKSIKKGFKVDRRANFERMMARKAGTDLSSGGGSSNAKNRKQLNSSNSAHTRVKSITFNEQDRREYLLSLHKKKNERRVQAFVDAKRKLRKESAKTRREQREEARRAYNNYARIPILPNYTYRLPTYTENAVSDDDDDDDEDNEDSDSDNINNDNLAEGGKNLNDDNEKCKRRKHKLEREAILSNSTHEMPWAMMHSSADHNVEKEEESIEESNAIDHANEASNDESFNRGGDNKEAKVNSESEVITVEVKPLFSNKYTSLEQNNASDKLGSSHGRLSPKESLAKKGNAMTNYTLPNNDFSDLPSIVEEELRKLRQATKGPARTPARVKMLKELEKIRKIKKHSRKGHGKKSSSGKRKNRRK